MLDRQFTATRPNQRWIADFTYVWTAEGWLYVAAVIDLFSRRVVGWSMKAEMTAALVTDALAMAIWRRGKPYALLHHSDQGSQYTSQHFQELLAENGVNSTGSKAIPKGGPLQWGADHFFVRAGRPSIIDPTSSAKATLQPFHHIEMQTVSGNIVHPSLAKLECHPNH